MQMGRPKRLQGPYQPKYLLSDKTLTVSKHPQKKASTHESTIASKKKKQSTHGPLAAVGGAATGAAWCRESRRAARRVVAGVLVSPAASGPRSVFVLPPGATRQVRTGACKRKLPPLRGGGT